MAPLETMWCMVTAINKVATGGGQMPPPKIRKEQNMISIEIAVVAIVSYAFGVMFANLVAYLRSGK